MVKKKLPIKWDRKALEDLRFIYEHIAQDSVSSAKRVIKTLSELAEGLNDFPKKYPVESLLAADGNYRYAVKWSYKIIYEVTDKEIIVAYIFHTKQSSEKLKA